MKIYTWALLSILFIGLSACSKDDDTDDDGGSTDMETTRMEARVDGQVITFDTLNASEAATLVLQGKPYSGFVPSIALTIKKEQTVGEHQFAVTGEVEAAQYTGTVNGRTEVFIAKSGSVNITEHRVNDYIKGTFNFIGAHASGTLPDVEVTDGEFEAFY
jgi:hypothetical protein